MLQIDLDFMELKIAILIVLNILLLFDISTIHCILPLDTKVK